MNVGIKRWGETSNMLTQKTCVSFERENKIECSVCGLVQ